jgi:hypothetical protein
VHIVSKAHSPRGAVKCHGQICSSNRAHVWYQRSSNVPAELQIGVGNGRVFPCRSRVMPATKLSKVSPSISTCRSLEYFEKHFRLRDTVRVLLQCSSFHCGARTKAVRAATSAAHFFGAEDAGARRRSSSPAGGSLGALSCGSLEVPSGGSGPARRKYATGLPTALLAGSPVGARRRSAGEATCGRASCQPRRAQSTARRATRAGCFLLLSWPRGDPGARYCRSLAPLPRLCSACRVRVSRCVRGACVSRAPPTNELSQATHEGAGEGVKEEEREAVREGGGGVGGERKRDKGMRRQGGREGVREGGRGGGG